MKNVVGFVIGIGLFALKAVINPFGTAADLISNVADVWTEFAGDGAQKGIEKIAEKIKEKRDFNKIAEKFRSELSAIYEGAEGESLAEKIFRELADAENAEKGKRIGFKKKPKKGAVMSDLIIKEIFGADLEEYLKANSATFRNLLSDKQKEAFAAVMREAQRAYLEINFKGLDKELQIVAEVTANAVVERGEKNANKAVGELKEFFISLFSKNGGDTTVGELVKGAVVRKLQYVEKSCPNCGAYGDRVIHKKDKQGNVYEISCGVCGNSYFVLRDVADDNAALENFIKEHGDREEEARRELYSLYLRKFEETDKILFDVKDAVGGLLNITEQGFETMNTKLEELKSRPNNRYDEIMKLGKSYLDLCEFTLAYDWYRAAAELCPGRAEAFFGMALAKCEVQLVYDYNNCREQPICYKKDIDFSSNAEYKTALKNSAAEQKAYFEKIADRINKIVYWLTKYEEEGRKYDCFICTKVSVKRGSDEKTDDCKWIESNRLCAKLKEDNGISTFYSEIDCKDKVGEQYEALVLYALNKAKCMIVVCSNEEYLETPWVKNEYRRFCGILNRRGVDLGAIIIVYNGTPVKLPGLDREGFQDVNRRDDNAVNNLIDGVKRRVRFNWDRKYCLKCIKNYPKDVPPYCANCGALLVSARKFYETKTKEEQAALKAEIEKVKAEKESELEKERKAREEAEKKALEAEKLRKQYEEQEKRIKALEAELLKKQSAEVAVAGPLNLDNDGLVDFEIEDGVLIEYLGEAKHVVIPDGVTSIGACAFEGCSSLKSIEIPAGVTSIGAWAFDGCSSLKSIEIPTSVTEIGRWAFKECSSLKSITIPTSVTSIGDCAFKECSSLKSIEIPTSVTSIGDCAFEGCSSLESITIPKSVTSIGICAFEGCSSLESIEVASGNKVYHSSGNCLIEIETKKLIRGCNNSVIPDDGSVTSIATWAFKECSSLKSIEIPTSVTSIGALTFLGCSSLESIKVESGNKVYHSAGNCLIETETKKLILGCKNSVIPDDGSATSIGICAFEGCSSLESIEIPKSVTSIGDCAFEDCSSLEKIIIPKSVIDMGENAFDGCPDNLVIYCEAESQPKGWKKSWFGSCKAKAVWGYNKNQTNETKITPELLTLQNDEFEIKNGVLIKYYGEKENAVIPEGVVEIGRDAFMWCGSLIKIEIPAGVTKIGDGAFTFCGALKRVKIPQSVTEIGLHPFYACNSLESITVETGNKVYSVSGNCLIENKAKKLLCGCNNSVIPTDGSVTEIEAYAFGGLDNLNKIFIPDSVIKVGECIFENYDGDLIVNCAAKTEPDGWDEYWLADCSAKVVWGYNKNQTNETKTTPELLTLQNDEFEIKDGVLIKYKGKKEKVIIPIGVTKIGAQAFLKCGFIREIVIPASVTEIGDDAFQNCSLLYSIDIPASVTIIGTEAFSGCKLLEEVEIPERVVRIGEYAFLGCSIEKIIIPESVETVGEYAFDCYLSENFKIYCRAKKQPAGWHKDWNKGAKTVISTIKSKLFDNEDAEFSGRYKTVWNYKGN